MQNAIRPSQRVQYAAARAAVLGMLLLSSLCAGAVELPPIALPGTAERHVGKVTWHELTTPDLAVAKAFYGGLFSWTFSEVYAGKAAYAVALLDGRPVAGLVQKALPAAGPVQPAWLPFLSVADVDVARAVALEHGAHAVGEARTYLRRGRQAILTDPDGAAFAVLAAAGGDPQDYLVESGEWIWSSLLSLHADADIAFYQAVFGYDVFDLDSADGEVHATLCSDDFARASINSLPQDAARRRSHWMNFVRVGDAQAAAVRAVELGGRIAVAPRLDRHGGRFAILADPSGAHFGVMEWPESVVAGEAK